VARTGLRKRSLGALAALSCVLPAALGLAAERAHAKHRRTAAARGPNIVFVLTDDLSMNLLRFMPHVVAMQRHGVTFNDYFVSDSLCCPSRSSIFTGNFPHDTKIFSNTGRQGGFDRFHARGEERHTFAVALHRAGYRTAMMGKYLNGYMGAPSTPMATPPTYVPPGWDRWDVVGWGYPEFNYLLNHNGRLRAYGNRPADYLTDVLAHDAVDFIGNASAARKPFFLEVAPFAPHSPYVPAPRSAGDFPGLRAPQAPNFNQVPWAAPKWLSARPALTSDQIHGLDTAYRLRAQSVEAVDGMIGQIENALRANHLAGDTYLVFSSDNGFHLGEHRLLAGKMTAFDTDIHVPLIVQGPGVAAGTSTDAMAENIDLASTFAGIGATTLRSDGHTLLPLLGGTRPAGWRDTILVEHRGPPLRSGDPDFQQPSSGNPPSYEAMRTHDFLYVEYKNGEREYYNLRADPFELDNLVVFLSRSRIAQLHTQLLALERCHGGPACWAATHGGGPAGARRRRPGRR
jgi:N-acetylglucosamine-6-sulfatase